MVEPFADQLKTHPQFCPLNISEGFSKGMCAIIAFKVYGFAPLLNHAVYGHNRKRLLVGIPTLLGMLILFLGRLCPRL